MKGIESQYIIGHCLHCIHCLQARPCIFQPKNFTGWSSEGVKAEQYQGPGTADSSLLDLNTFQHLIPSISYECPNEKCKSTLSNKRSVNDE